MTQVTRNFQPMSPTTPTQPPVDGRSDLAVDIMRTLTMDRDSRYLEGTAIDRWREELGQLMADTISGCGERTVLAAEFAKGWIHHNMDFLIRGQRLLDICEGINHEELSATQRETMHLAERLLETISLNAESGNKVLATLEPEHIGLFAC
jgi:hypothetical protein